MSPLQTSMKQNYDNIAIVILTTLPYTITERQFSTKALPPKFRAQQPLNVLID
jgi:hypothetical protein